jgi:PAS domain S-box-containing protein
VTLRRRLLLSQAPLAAALVLVGATAVWTVSFLGDSSDNILKDNYRSVLAAQRMNAALDLLDREALVRALGRPSVAPAAPAAVPSQQFESELRVQEGNVTEPGEAEATLRLRAAWVVYRDAQGAAAREPMPAYLDAVHRASTAVREATDEVLALNQDAMVRKSNLARRTSERLLRLMLAATVLALGLGLLASMAITARMVRPLSALTQAVRRFGEGDLEARARPKGKDEIAELGREFDTMADRLEEYRKSSLGDLLQAQQASQAAIDSLPDPVLVLDTQGRLSNLNRAAESLLRLAPGEGVGKPVHSLDPALRERLEAVRAHVLGGRGAVVPHGFEESVRVDLPDGPRRLLPRATALYSAEGAVVGVTIVLQDVTRLMRFEELKDDLVATAAHEFRTPLTSLHMAIHLLAEEAAGTLTERQADLTAAARQDCERLQGIVDDILDLSRIQGGLIELHRKPVDARWLVAQAAAGVEGSARAAGVALAVEAPEEPLPVLADVERVDVVLANLAGNGVRHSPPGARLVVRVARDGGSIRFEVRDEGEGIAPQYQERIFERFFQVPGGKRGGVGLGLYISREIVRAHGGEMGVESEPGKGSTFWFTLPVAGDAPRG